MSDKQAIQNDIDVETVAVDDDLDESVVEDRELRAPSITHLGRYRLVREIASGGMATVNLAVAEGLEKLVALKIIHPHLAKEESFVRMFLDEARLASAISHRNVCNVFDFGETDGRYYIAMDYLSGQSLRDVLRRLRKNDLQLEPRKLAVYIAYMLAEACEGLHAAHELHGADGKPLNVVHRDVSPHNLFVTYDGNVSVVDFGIARASDRIQSTATGVLKGKFSYMAPEQMRQLEIDRRADVWALGVVLWESLTLQRLFVRSSQADTVMSVMMDRVRPPSEVSPDLPKELDAIALRAIARSPAHRFATAREMGRELMKFCRESGVMVSPIEIETLMERLFEKEIADSKLLLRQAKRSHNESGIWMDVTPSGFARVGSRTNTGQMTSSSISVVGTGTGSNSAPRPPQNSQTAPAAEARGTAHPEQAGTAHGKSKKRGLVVAIGFALCAAFAAGYVALRPTKVEQIAATNIIDGDPDKTLTGAQAPATGATATAEQQSAHAPSAVEPAAKQEPTPPSIKEGATRAVPTPVQRNEPVRRDVRGRPIAKPQASAQPAREQPDANGSPTRNVNADELAVRGSEPAPTGNLAAEEAPPPPAPAPVPQVAAAAPAVVAPTPAAVRPTPAAPQKLDAQASFADLDVEGSLGSSIVSRMLSRVTPAIKSCYGEAAKRAGRNDFSPLAVSFVIDEMGFVRQVTAGKHGLPDLGGCVSGSMKRMRAERVPDVGTVQVRLKVNFSP
jgi:eukaryotic-like serine/threonine-protein kinase